MSRLAFTPVVGLCCVVLASCADPYEGRQAITGKITVKGAPLKEASIQFEPLDGQATRAGAGVTDGTYSIPRDAGLKPGKYLIRLTAGDGKTPTSDEEAGGPGGSTNIVSVDLIPADYGVASKQQVEVKDGGNNTFNIDLPFLNDPTKSVKKAKGKK